MTEREKMQNNMLYDCSADRDLAVARVQCKTLCQEYNALPIGDRAGRRQLIKKILKKTGEHIHIEPDFWCDYGFGIQVGENFYANHGLVILDAGGVTFGDNVFIGPSCGFHTSGHPVDYQRRNEGWEYAWPIVVGNNVWFGAGVQVLPGVTIGDNCVIGAGSVVTKDIPSNVIAVGNPCRVLREITEEDKRNSYQWRG